MNSTRGARGAKDCHFQNVKMYKNGKVDSLKASMLPKIRIISKKVSSKSCSGFNFVQKRQCAHTYVYLSQECSNGAPKIAIFKMLKCLKTAR